MQNSAIKTEDDLTTPIPLHLPYFGSEEEAAVCQAVRSTHQAGDGPISHAAERLLSDLLQVPFVFLTGSCTHALELALMALEIGIGDEVICPSYTFTSTATAVVQQRAKPVFVDIDQSTLNIDPAKLEMALSERTRAIIVVHYAGVACDMDPILQFARRNKLFVIEDNAHGIGAKYNQFDLGTIGDIGCFSFHDTKNVVCGEGGAIVTKDQELARRIEIIRQKGTDRSAFIRREVDKYTWRSKGSSYLLSDLLAAILKCQLHKLEVISSRRREIFYRYLDNLHLLQSKNWLALPHVPHYAWCNGHIFYIRFQSNSILKHVRDRLIAEGISCATHYVPLHSSPFGIELSGGRIADLPITDRVGQTLLRLPIHPHLSLAQVDFISDRVAQALNEISLRLD